MTNPATMQNHIDMQRVMFVFGDERLHQPMRLCVAASFGDQSHATADAQDMRIHRKHRALAGEQQHTADGLRTYAFE